MTPRHGQRQRYKEGTLFAVPLPAGGFALGLITRKGKGGVLCGYFWGPRRVSIPTVREVSGLSRESATLVLQFGALGLMRGHWPVIGQWPQWRREDWPLPQFVRTDAISGEQRLVTYDDATLAELCEQPCFSQPSASLPRDCLSGYGAVEIKLSKLIA